MMQTDDDKKVINNLNHDLKKFAYSLNDLSSYVANCNVKTKIENKKFKNKAFKLSSEINKLNNFRLFNKKAKIFLNESMQFINLVKNSDLKAVKKFIKNSRYLFKAACGVRHVDFIAYKPVR